MHCFVAKDITERLELKLVTIALKVKIELPDGDFMIIDKILIG